MHRREPPPSVCEGARLLRQWRLAHGISQRRFQALVNSSRRTCHEWEFGAKVPTVLFAARIEETTDGACPVEAWGYTDADIAAFVAFGIRRARKAGLIPPVRTSAPAGGAIILGPKP